MLSAVRHAVLATVSALLPGVESGTAKKQEQQGLQKPCGGLCFLGGVMEYASSGWRFLGSPGAHADPQDIST